MEFLAPLMLVGALGVAVPILIHLIGRRRAREVDFAAMDFLLGSDQKVARRLRLRELLLLILRAAVCLAIALILAKPFTTCDARGPVVERGPQAAVLVVDDSLASRLSVDGTPLLSRSVARARAILEGLGPEAEVALLLTSEGSDLAAELSRDHLALRDRVAGLTSTFRPADTTAALRRAASLLAGSDHETRTIYLVAPMAAAAFREPGVPWKAGPDAPTLRLVDVADDVTIDNAAVVELRVEGDPASGPRGLRIVAEVANFGDEAVIDREISLRLDGEIVARGQISIDPGERQSKRFSAALSPEHRTAEVAVEISADALPADDRRRAIAELREQVPVLLVNGDPRTTRHEDELFYLEAALRPGDRADSGAQLSAITAGELDETELSAFDVVVLANVAALGDEAVTRLATWVESGGGLLIAVGDNVDPDRYNASMARLLPQRLQSALDVSHGPATGDASLHLSKIELDHPIFGVFSKDAAALREARFSVVMLLGPTTDVDLRRVLARYDNGAAALVEARRGEGRLLFFSSSIDRAWNDLPIHPGYLPFAQQAIRYLARKPFHRREETLLVGRNAMLRVSAEDARLEIDGPGDRRAVIEGDELGGRELLRFAATDAPGFYRVRATDQRDRSRDRPEATFAVNVDPRASDLRRLDPSTLRAGDADEPADAAPATARQRRVELWHAIAVGLLGLLVIESLLGLGLPRRRRR